MSVLIVDKTKLEHSIKTLCTKDIQQQLEELVLLQNQTKLADI